MLYGACPYFVRVLHRAPYSYMIRALQVVPPYRFATFPCLLPAIPHHWIATCLPSTPPDPPSTVFQARPPSDSPSRPSHSPLSILKPRLVSAPKNEDRSFRTPYLLFEE